MKLEAFLHRLHYDVGEVRPHDFVVDWDDAPLPYKLYRGLPTVELAADVPLTLDVKVLKASRVPEVREIGHFLWYVYGLTQVAAGPWQLLRRRFAPSGGGLYPSEVYVYLKLPDLPAGVYHYDAAHHRLVLVREGGFDSYLARALGNRCDVSACFGAVFVSTMFWKNFFKYHNFSYRLQGLDAGVLIGQLLEAAKRFGYETSVYFQFLDLAVHHLLGLSEQEESVYAIIPLSVEPVVNWQDDSEKTPVTSGELCRELSELHHDHYIRSQTIREYPMLLKMNEASFLDSTDSFRQLRGRKAERVKGIALPKVALPYDFAAASRTRCSPGRDFNGAQVSRLQAAALLREATTSFSYRNDLDGAGEQGEPRVSIHGCFHAVDGIPDGAYRYHGASHVLQPIVEGDHRGWLQQGMTMQTVNLFQVPFCFHVTGDRDHLKTDLGYRGHRIQQMEAGMLVQRLLLAASALGMGGHPLLDFDVASCDRLYGIDSQWESALIQLPIGPYRPRALLQGGLHG